MRYSTFTAAAIAGFLLITACESGHGGDVPSGMISSDSKAGPSAPPPPPPPPPPALTSEAVGRMADAEMVAPPRRETKPLPQSGTLTAGDYDDVLNPGLYRAYVKRMLGQQLANKNLPHVDAADRIKIHVTDRLGKPAPFATVMVLDSDGDEMFPLTTGARGEVYLYPEYDTLDETISVKATPLNGGAAVSQTIDLTASDTPDKVELSFASDAEKVKKLDLLLTIDATGSMADEMRYLQSELLAILGRVEDAQGQLDIHAGLIVYRDTGDQYVVRAFDFTGDLEAFSDDLKAQKASGGGDFPEAMQDAMSSGLEFDWREDAIKVNMLVADAPPHDKDISATWDSALYSRTRGIHIVPLAASGVDDTAEFLMRSMGQITGGRYLFLTDDSGVGNAHAEPTVDCYVVTRLDSLVERVLTDLITGLRVEPDGDEVIRTVGNYKAGICKVDQ